MTPPLHETLISDPPQTVNQMTPISLNLGQELGFLKRRSMPMPRRIEADLDEAESFVGEFGAAFESLKSHASAIVSFSHQWESTQRSFIAMKSLIASRVEEMDKREEEMRRLESELSGREKGIEMKRLELEGVEKTVEAKRSELESKEKSIEERFREIELKKYELECKEKSIEVRFKEIETKKNELGSLEKSIRERMKEFELKEKRFIGNPGGVVVKTEPVSEFGVGDGGDDNDASLRLCVKMDGKALQLFLNDRFNEHESMGDQVYYALRLSKNPARLVLDAMEGFFAPHSKKGDSEYEARIVRSSCLLLLDQLLKLNQVERLVKEKARDLVVLWREKMKGEGESYMVVLGFLMLLAVYDLSGEIEKNELGRLLCLIAITPVSQVALVGDGQPQLRTPQVVNSVTRCTTGPKDVLDTLCKEMDAKGLSSYLMFHGNVQNLSQKKVLDGLRFASDPARLVFNVLQGFCETCSDDNIQRESNTTVSTPLLEQLMELSPDVTSDLRAEASKFAAHWKARLDKEEAKARKSASNGKASPGKDGTLPSDVFCFLMFLTVYKLGSYFDGNEIVALFGTCYNDDEVYRLEQNVHLCHSLSLEDKIPGIVEALIKKKKLLVAVRYICAFDLVSRFPPFPLLKQYVEMEIKRCKTRNTVSGQNKLAWREVIALRHAMKCISDHKQLESQCSLSVFGQRIQQLKAEIAERNRKAAEVAPDDKKNPSPSSSSRMESAQIICSSSTKGPGAQVRRKRTASASTNGPRPRETTQEKCLKLVDTCTSRCQPPEKSQENSPRTATPNINSDAGTCAAKPPSRPPCSTGPVTNHHASVMSNAGNSCSTGQQTNAPVNSHYQISYPSPSVTSHVPGWPDGAPAAVPASGQRSYFNQTQLVPGAYYPGIGFDPWQFVTGGAYPGIGPSHIPHSPVYNQPTQMPGIVEALIKKKKLLVAVGKICKFNLVSRFPPFPLLQQYVEMEIKRCKTRNTVSGQNKLAWREVIALRHVMKCISDHKQLESQCSLSVFGQRIQQLKAEIAERNRKAAEVAPDDKKIPSPSSTSRKESAQIICSSSTKGPGAQVRRKRTASASTNGPHPRETTQEKRLKLVDTCTSRCQPPEKSQENSPRTATPNINSDAGTCAAKPPSQPPCSTGPVTNHHASVMSNAGNSCSTGQQTSAPVNSHYQISYPSPSVTSHVPGWPDGAPAAVPASGQRSYFNQTQLVPGAYYPGVGFDPRQFVMGGAYPGIGPSHIPHGPVFNQPTQTPGYQGQFYNPFGDSPCGAQQIFYHTQ